MSDSKKFVFSIEALNDVLTQTKSIKKKLNPFLARFQQYEMSEIYQTFDYLHQCMTKPKAELKFKFNSLFVLKVFLDTSNYVLVNWIEVFFLPHILQIAKFNIGGQNNGKDYFLKQGYTAADDPEVQKFGFNYTLLAIELLQVAALVKPFKLFESEFTSTRSDFSLAFEQLKKAGYKPPQKLSIYAKPQTVQSQVAKYEEGLTQISQSIEQFLDIYGEFSNTKLEEYLRKPHGTEQENYHISIIQLYESGDLYLSSSAIEICKAELSQPKSLLTFQNSLKVLHRLMLAGDYECFYVLNFEDGLSKALTDVVDCDKTERGLKRGEKFFAPFKNPKQSLRVYTLFLDNLEKWALFGSGFAKQYQNFIKKVVMALTQTAKLQFPEPSNLEAQKNKIQSGLTRNKQRSKRLAQQIEKSQSALKNILSYINSSKPAPSASEIKTSTKKEPIITSTKLQSNTPMPSEQKSNKDLPFIQQLDSVQEVYDKFLNDSANYDKNKVVLEKFLANFQNDLATIPDEVFDQVYERAANLQMDVQEVLKKAQVSKSVKKQEQSKLEPNKSIAPIESDTKIETKKVESETIIQPKLEVEKKSLARMQPSKDSRKMNNSIEDTPVKKFQIEDSQRNYEMNEAEKLGFHQNIKIESKQEILQEKLPKASEKVSLGDQERNFISNLSNKNIPSSNKNIVSTNNLGLGYAEPPKQPQYIHPSIYGYKQEPQQVQQIRKTEILRQTTIKREQPPKQIPSNKVIRKTEDLSQSRKSISNSKKNLEESSIKSNSKVEHFSPESSQFSQHDNREYENSNFKKKPFEAEDIQIPLEEFEEKLYINKPKQFKSLTGQARESKQKAVSQVMTPEKQLEKLELRSKEDLNEKEPSQHNVSSHSQGASGSHNLPNLGFASQQIHIPAIISPKNMPSSHYDLQEEQQEEQLILDEDQIDPPHLNPLEESFHDISELEQKIKQKLNTSSNASSNDLSFKNCFETDKYILQRQEDKKTKMYWLENETTNLVKNILVKKEQSRVSKINVPEILDERNKKYQQQLKIVEEEKNRKIRELQNKVKNLQKESQFFKEQAAQHAEQIRTLKANSDFDKESVGQKGYLKDVENIAMHKLSSPQRFGYSNVKSLHFDTSSFKQTMYLDPKGKLINSKNYKPYFQQFIKEKEKKLMLKSKDLLYKDKDIEIGFMSKKENDRLIVTLYLTPERDIESLTWNVTHDTGLTVESEPNSFITYVRTKKQEKIFFTIQVIHPGFTLPVVEFTYTAAEQTQRVKVVLPCAFHKFFHIREADNDLNDFFKKSENIVRGEEVPYSKRFLKSLDSLKDYFQSMVILNKGVPNQHGEVSYGGLALYKGFQFPVRISVKPNQFLYVQAVLQTAVDEARIESPIVQYYISTVTYLLMKEIQ